jgi:hypothetical protein
MFRFLIVHITPYTKHHVVIRIDGLMASIKFSYRWYTEVLVRHIVSFGCFKETIEKNYFIFFQVKLVWMDRNFPNTCVRIVHSSSCQKSYFDVLLQYNC